MKNFIINIIYKIISLIDYIDYHYIKKEKLIDNYKTTEEIILNDIEILSDTGYKPLYSITITKPFDIYSIELENGYKLDCADEHRFFGETFNEIYSKLIILYGNIFGFHFIPLNYKEVYVNYFINETLKRTYEMIFISKDTKDFHSYIRLSKLYNKLNRLLS